MANKLANKIDKYEETRDKHPEDYEGIHIAQDQVYRDFIVAVASGKFKTIAQAKETAKDIVKSVIADEKKFARWYS